MVCGPVLLLGPAGHPSTRYPYLGWNQHQDGNATLASWLPDRHDHLVYGIQIPCHVCRGGQTPKGTTVKSKLICEFSYDGLGFQTKRLRKHREVEILGIMLPCDPGVVTIKDGDEQRQVPTFALKPCPNFDFEALLSTSQKKGREQIGLLFYSGLDRRKPRLLPLVKCPIKKE
jgi:hypothetical protein